MNCNYCERYHRTGTPCHSYESRVAVDAQQRADGLIALAVTERKGSARV